MAELQYQSRREDIVNSVIHGAGIGLSIVALVLLVVFGSIHGDVWQVVSFSIFGATLIFLYLSSTLFHGVTNLKAQEFFRKCDYIGIFLLIAGTYTPIMLIYLRGPWGWSLFGVIWFLALLGIGLRIFFSSKIELALAILYVLMGWIIMVATRPALDLIPSGVLIWLLIGGMSYMIGLVFLAWKRLPFHHALWHLFVLGGSTAHFFGMFLYIGK
ncbi:MAG: hemolysin III family protein [Candidatus Moranbacteria bacterium]|nr:hemolysin III family protein [Candidatus Moranbacteria bacterium]